MKYCYEHTEKAHKLIQTACSQMMRESSNETSEGGKVFRTFIPWASNYDKAYLSSAFNNLQLEKQKLVSKNKFLKTQFKKFFIEKEKAIKNLLFQVKILKSPDYKIAGNSLWITILS